MRQKERKVKRPAAPRSRTQDTSGLSRQCSATEPRQPDDHQPSQSSICTAQVVLNASVTWSSGCHGSVAEHWRLKPEVSLKLRVGPTSKPSGGRVSVPVKKASKSPILRSTSPPMDNEQDAHVIPYCYNSMQALPRNQCVSYSVNLCSDPHTSNQVPHLR